MRLLDFVLRNLSEFLGPLFAVSLFVLWRLVGPVVLAPTRRQRIPAGVGGEGGPPLEKEGETLYYREQSRVRRALAVRLVALAGTFVFSLAMGMALFVESCRTDAQTAALKLPEPRCSKPENVKLLLFVHGWGGGDDTWNKFPELACEDPRLGDVDILVFNYPTFALRRNLNITQLARFAENELGPKLDAKYQRVAIVAHSMGGLVAREFALMRTIGGKVTRVGALVEVATPHAGADPASLGSALGLKTRQTEEMAANSSFLQTLRTHWNVWQRRPITHCATSPQDRVVSETSALTDCYGMHQYYPLGGHRELVKPQSRDDARYEWPISRALESLHQ